MKYTPQLISQQQREKNRTNSNSPFPISLIDSVFGKKVSTCKKFKFDKKSSIGKGKGLNSTLRSKNRATKLLLEIVTFEKALGSSYTFAQSKNCKTYNSHRPYFSTYA
jgi:hypothetical protein